MSDFVFCQDCGKILTQSKGEYDHGCLDCHGSVQSEKLFWLRKENKKLKAAVLELSEALEFYSRLNNWHTDGIVDHCMDVISVTDTEYCAPSEKYGGKRARETLARYEELLKQLKEQT